MYTTPKAMLPHGHGTELHGSHVIYQGQWKGGVKYGSGTLYYKGSKQPKYIGQFKR